MDDVDILRELINDEALALVEPSNNKNVITLKEINNGSQPEYTVKIHGAPDDVIVIKADLFRLQEKFLKVRKENVSGLIMSSLQGLIDETGLSTLK